MNYLATLAAAGLLALSTGAASAATITFGNYTSSNDGEGPNPAIPDSLTPLVTVSDEVPGGFLVTVTHVAPSNGSLNLIAFDLGTAVFTSGDVTNVSDNGTAMTLASPCPGGQGPAVGRFPRLSHLPQAVDAQLELIAEPLEQLAGGGLAIDRDAARDGVAPLAELAVVE